MAKKRVKDTLRELGVKPSKERGQNFAIAGEVIDGIVRFGNPSEGENLIEIGPGLGALTKSLAPFGPLTLIELEEEFCKQLAAEYPDAKIINSDVRKVDFSELGEDLTVYGNLPYVFSTDIIFHLIDNRASVSRAILLLQREFAERVASEPCRRSYGMLSVMTQLWCETRLGPIFAGDCFHPPAKVESRVLELTFSKEPRVPIEDFDWFRRIAKFSFAQKRRTIRNNLLAANIVSAEILDEILEEAAIEPKRRAETFTLEEFQKLAELLRARVN